MKLETLCLHAGQEPDPSTLSRGVPLYRTSSYVFRNTEHAANLFALKELGNIYTRLMNPTTDVLEQRVAALEGGVGALAFASGTSAIYNTIINVCQAGDEILSANNLYGGTFTQFDELLPQQGIKVNFVDIRDLSAVRSGITEKSKLLYCETVSNPALDVSDLKSLADIAHKAGIPLVVDSTFTTPYLCRPIEHGADIVIHSLTKWFGGHGTGIGGIVVDAGKFKWDSGKFPLFSEPNPGYHGMRFGIDLPEPLLPAAFILRMRTVPLRNLGACISPDNAWMFLQGIETLPLRMEKHCSNALKVAEYLLQHESVKWVRYPGLTSDPSHDKARKTLSNGFGAMVIFGIQGGRDAGEKFINSLELISHLANVGDAKSLALHPGSTSHSQMTPEQQEAGGIKPELVRLSIGIENHEDIIADIDQALNKV